jgi:hypothetical protein
MHGRLCPRAWRGAGLRTVAEAARLRARAGFQRAALRRCCYGLRGSSRPHRCARARGARTGLRGRCLPATGMAAAPGPRRRTAPIARGGPAVRRAHTRTWRGPARVARTGDRPTTPRKWAQRGVRQLPVAVQHCHTPIHNAGAVQKEAARALLPGRCGTPADPHRPAEPHRQRGWVVVVRVVGRRRRAGRAARAAAGPLQRGQRVRCARARAHVRKGRVWRQSLGPGAGPGAPGRRVGSPAATGAAAAGGAAAVRPRARAPGVRRRFPVRGGRGQAEASTAGAASSANRRSGVGPRGRLYGCRSAAGIAAGVHGPPRGRRACHGCVGGAGAWRFRRRGLCCCVGRCWGRRGAASFAQARPGRAGRAKGGRVAGGERVQVRLKREGRGIG